MPIRSSQEKLEVPKLRQRSYSEPLLASWEYHPPLTLQILSFQGGDQTRGI